MYNSSIDLISNRDILFDKKDNNKYPKKSLFVDSFTQTEEYENNKKQNNPQFINYIQINLHIILNMEMIQVIIILLIHKNKIKN